MRVNTTTNNPVQGSELSSAKKAGKAGAAEEAAKKARADKAPAIDPGSVKADLSAKGREFARAKEVATNAPDVREEKIAALKRKIAEGKYQVNPDAVADRLVDEHLKTANIG